MAKQQGVTEAALAATGQIGGQIAGMIASNRHDKNEQRAAAEALAFEREREAARHSEYMQEQADRKARQHAILAMLGIHLPEPAAPAAPVAGDPTAGSPWATPTAGGGGSPWGGAPSAAAANFRASQGPPTGKDRPWTYGVPGTPGGPTVPGWG